MLEILSWWKSNCSFCNFIANTSAPTCNTFLRPLSFLQLCAIMGIWDKPGLWGCWEILFRAQNQGWSNGNELPMYRLYVMYMENTTALQVLVGQGDLLSSSLIHCHWWSEGGVASSFLWPEQVPNLSQVPRLHLLWCFIVKKCHLPGIWEVTAWPILALFGDLGLWRSHVRLQRWLMLEGELELPQDGEGMDWTWWLQSTRAVHIWAAVERLLNPRSGVQRCEGVFEPSVWGEGAGSTPGSTQAFGDEDQPYGYVTWQKRQWFSGKTCPVGPGLGGLGTQGGRSREKSGRRLRVRLGWRGAGRCGGE